MIAAIHQPNYIPWLGFFHKIYHCDVFILLDNVKYSKNTVINRNKIKTPNGWMYLTVPVLTKNRSEELISETFIDNHQKWKEKHLKTILLNYGKSEYFSLYNELFSDIYKTKWIKLVELNQYIICEVIKELGINTKIINATDLHVEGRGNELLINICKAVGADTYLSGKGAAGFIDKKKYDGYIKADEFTKEGIQLTFQEFEHPTYNQLYGDFIPNMSVIDLLFNCGPRSLENLLCENTPL